MKHNFGGQLEIQLKKVLSITIFWVFIATCQFLYEYLLLVHYEAIPIDYQFWTYYLITLMITVIAGLLGGAIIVYFLEERFRTRPYGRALLMVVFLHTIVFLFVMSISYSLTYSLNRDVPIYDASVWQSFGRDLQSVNYWKNYTLWLLIALSTIAGLFINDKYGPGLLQEFLLGRYFHPKREERIFMFLDLRASTTIAEKLGEVKYINIVKEVFKDATAPILLSKGEIYKYVGDEIIISWKMGNGLENANCLNCFFEIQRALRQKAPEYKSKFGVVPEFKAGLHYGYVMAGEIGVVKRDIVFSGDVLNTASRIQSKCNELGVDILFSRFLFERLALPPHLFNPQKIGDMPLRGKQEKVVLYTVL